jgi:iron complex outermembrane receptor protein|tara:strand:- start:193 stop:2571 length:2379 start_codon:yes stop_codon:yes gene_type:complete
MGYLSRLSGYGIAGSFAVLAAFSGPVMAAAGKNAFIEEVVVTARKQEESVQDVPIAMTALTQELENSSIRNLSDLDGYAPNLLFGTNGSRGGGGADINIRGISPTRSDDNSFDAPIAVVIDGIYLGTAAGQVLENFDLERVEVLRGPQGTLFGKNTVGGVVNVVRSRPTGETGGKFKLTVGDFGQQEARGVFNTSLGENIALKLFGTKIDGDGFMDNITTGNGVGEKDYFNVGATFLINPTDDFEARLTVETFSDEGTLNTFHTNYNTPAGLLPAPPAGSPENNYNGGFVTCNVFGACRDSLDRPEVSDNDKDNNYSLDTNALTLNMTLDLDENLTVVSVTGYREVDEYRIYDYDASSHPFITIERFNEYDQVSQELRIDGNFDRLTFTAGLYYFKNEFEQDWYTGDTFWGFLFGASLGNPDLGGPGVSGLAVCKAGGFAPIICDPGMTDLTQDIHQILYETQETTSTAVFAQMDYDLTDQLVLTAGVRWTKEEKHFIAGQAYLTQADRERLRQFSEYADLTQDWTEVSPKIGLKYVINDTSMVFASVSEGFHSGGFFGVNQNIRDFERDQYDPEYATNYELGYKSQHLGNRLRFNATYFRNEFEDKQESFVALDPDTKTVASIFDNAGSVLYSGIEVEMQFVFNNYFRAFVNYGTLDADYEVFDTDVNPNDGVTVVEDATFLTPRNSPDYTLGVGGTLSVPVGNGTVEAFMKVTKIAAYDSALLNLKQAKVGAREELSLSVGYYAENWAIEAYGKNLTDQRFETFFPIATLFAAGNVNSPRTLGLEFTYEF